METTITKVDESIMEMKSQAWGKIGVAVYTTELQLKAMTAKAIADLKYPEKIADIPNAEEQLKAFGAKEKEVIELRKTVTDPVKQAFERLMIPEKSFDEHKKKFSSCIIQLKTELEKEKQKEAQKNNEIRLLKERVVKHCAELDASIKLFANDLIDKAFVKAITDRIIIPEIGKTIEKWSARGIERIMEYKFPKFELSPSFITMEEAQSILKENFTINLIDYANAFDFMIKEKFKDYEVAFHNAKDALKLNAQQKEEAAKAIADEKLTAEITASIQSSATPLNATPEVITKDLKKVFVVDMPETFESAMLILAAFMGNKDKCLKKTTTKKWFAFNATSAANALEKVKNEDNLFAPTGIIFKETVKL